VIKSGGEWISSLDLENELMAHPAVAEATVVGSQARQVAGTTRGLRGQGGGSHRGRAVRASEERVATWWLPDRIVFVDAIPKTGTGKFDKKVVREMPVSLALQDQWLKLDT
jgi:fatty-acyl-CoA synthase